MGYGTAQKCAFAGLVIGFLMCAAGAFTPFWTHLEINVDTLTRLFSISIPILGSTQLVTIDTGLWWYCIEYLGYNICEVNEIKQDDSAKIWTCRLASVVSVVLGLICALAGLCRTCCFPGGQTVFHGVIAFLAGGAGIVTFAVYATTTSENDRFFKDETSYYWAFFVYMAGSFIMFVVSFVLCFAAPDNSLAQVYPNPMYTGPSTAMYPGQHQARDLQQILHHPYSTQPQINSEDTTKHSGWD